MNIHQIEHTLKGADPVFIIGVKVLSTGRQNLTGFSQMVVSFSFYILKMYFFHLRDKYFLTCSEWPTDD